MFRCKMLTGVTRQALPIFTFLIHLLEALFTLTLIGLDSGIADQTTTY